MAVTLSELESLTLASARAQWHEIVRRPPPLPGRRGPHFTAVEEVLSYAALFIVSPSTQGGSDWSKYHPVLQQIGAALRRSPGSIANKGANLIGTRAHGQRHETQIYVALGSGALPFPEVYRIVLRAAREVGVSGELLPDFLNLLRDENAGTALFLGDQGLTVADLLTAAWEISVAEGGKRSLEQAIADVRIARTRLARQVLGELGPRCVFCGMNGQLLPGQVLTAAILIKPWRASSSKERRDPHNGLIGCPTHATAFANGLLAVEDDGTIRATGNLHAAIADDPAARRALEVRDRLVAPRGWQAGRLTYLAWHREHVWLRSDSC